MAIYPSPSENLPIFNDSVFGATANTGLTIAEGAKYFVTYPTSQPLINTQTTNVTGALSVAGNITANANLSFQQTADPTQIGQLIFSDGTIQTTAGGGSGGSQNLQSVLNLGNTATGENASITMLNTGVTNQSCEITYDGIIFHDGTNAQQTINTDNGGLYITSTYLEIQSLRTPTFTVGINSGTTGQVLGSDGNGGVTWVTGGGGGGGDAYLANTQTFTGANTFTDAVTVGDITPGNYSTIINPQSIVLNSEIGGQATINCDGTYLETISTGLIVNIDSDVGTTGQSLVSDGTGHVIWGSGGGGGGDAYLANTQTFTGANTFTQSVTVGNIDAGNYSTIINPYSIVLNSEIGGQASINCDGTYLETISTGLIVNIGSNVGIAGQYLGSDGAGHVTWSAPTSSGGGYSLQGTSVYQVVANTAGNLTYGNTILTRTYYVNCPTNGTYTNNIFMSQILAISSGGTMCTPVQYLQPSTTNYVAGTAGAAGSGIQATSTDLLVTPGQIALTYQVMPYVDFKQKEMPVPTVLYSGQLTASSSGNTCTIIALTGTPNFTGIPAGSIVTLTSPVTGAFYSEFILSGSNTTITVSGNYTFSGLVGTIWTNSGNGCLKALYTCAPKVNASSKTTASSNLLIKNTTKGSVFSIVPGDMAYISTYKTGQIWNTWFFVVGTDGLNLILSNPVDKTDTYYFSSTVDNFNVYIYSSSRYTATFVNSATSALFQVVSGSYGPQADITVSPLSIRSATAGTAGTAILSSNQTSQAGANGSPNLSPTIFSETYPAGSGITTGITTNSMVNLNCSPLYSAYSRTGYQSIIGNGVDAPVVSNSNTPGWGAVIVNWYG